VPRDSTLAVSKAVEPGDVVPIGVENVLIKVPWVTAATGAATETKETIRISKPSVTVVF
jgi:hypothetical protein